MLKPKKDRSPKHPKDAKNRKSDKLRKVFRPEGDGVPAPSKMHSPIDELRDMPMALSELGGNYRGQLIARLARLYEISLCLRDNPDFLQDFCRLPEWERFKGKRPEIDNPNDVLQPCIRFAVGFDDKNASKTASKYFNALSVPFAERVPAAEVPAFIEHHGGIEELAKRAAKLRREGNNKPDDESAFLLVMPDSEVAEKLLAMALDKQFKATLMINTMNDRGQRSIKIVQVKSKD